MNDKIITRRKGVNFVIPLVLGSLFLLVFPIFAGPFYMHIFILVFLHVILVAGYRLLYVTGLASFCHITFSAIGAYTSALLAIELGLPFGVCFLAAGIMAGAAAFLLGAATVRTKGAYFFIISFAFWVVMDSTFKHWESVTYGLIGIRGIPPVMGLTGVTPYYFMALIFCALTIYVMYRLDRSRFGAELLAIGDADDLAEVIGINVVSHRVIAFTIGALFAGFAGSILTHYLRYISPLSFGMWPSIFVLVWCVIGGSRKLWGPIAGAVFMTLTVEMLRMTGAIQAIVNALALLIIVMVVPQGFVGLVDTLRTRFGRDKHLGGDIK